MIRHARLGRLLTPALPILSLPVAMIESPLRALLVSAIGTLPLAKPGVQAASRAAVALPTVTVGAEKEHRAACTHQANPQPEDHFAVNRHASWLAALDTTTISWQLKTSLDWCPESRVAILVPRRFRRRGFTLLPAFEPKYNIAQTAEDRTDDLRLRRR